MILPIIPKELKLYLSGVYGEAIGRYGSAQLPDATQAQSGENLPLKGSRLLAGITWDPDPQWTCYAYYGQEQLERKSWVDAATGKGYGYGSEPYDNSGASVLGARQWQPAQGVTDHRRDLVEVLSGENGEDAGRTAILLHRGHVFQGR
jgi:hypothetical protein